MEDKQVILIVDDDPTVLSMIGAMVRNCGYQAETAKNSEEAERLIDSSTAFSALLVDFSLGQTNGVELAEQLRRTQKVPTAIITGWSNKDVDDVNGFTCIYKPFTLETFRKALTALLEEN